MTPTKSGCHLERAVQIRICIQMLMVLKEIKNEAKAANREPGISCMDFVFKNTEAEIRNVYLNWSF